MEKEIEITVKVSEHVYEILKKASELADVPITKMASNFIRLGLIETSKACRSVINLNIED